MSDNSGILGEILEQGASAVKQTIKQVAKTPGDLAKAGAKQVKGTDQTKLPDQTQVDEKTKTEEFVKDLYGTNKKPAAGETQKSSQKKQGGEKPQESEEQKIEKLRRELHSNYYQKLVNPPKAPEEKPAEKVEREKKEERWELEQKEKKKPPPLAVQRAQKVEKYPGASG